jgi:hypothetical protein
MFIRLMRPKSQHERAKAILASQGVLKKAPSVPFNPPENHV